MGGKLLLLLDKNDKIHIYPDTISAKLTAGVAFQRLILSYIDESLGIVTGSRINPKTLKAVEVWRLNFDKTGEEIISYSADDQLGPDQYQGIEESNGKILYKFVDPNLMAITTFSAPNHLNVYIINRANGAILYTGHVYNVNSKEGVKISFVENTVMVTYLKKYSERATTLLNEVLVIEMYYPNIEDDVQKMFSQYYSSKGVHVGDQNSANLPTPKFLTQTYIIPIPIKDIILTRTRQGITNRHVLMLTTHNQIIALPGAILDAKRPTENPNREGANFEDPELPFYDAVVPLKFTLTISYDLTLSGITHIETIPHDYESTTLVIASGIDIFISTFSPENVFYCVLNK